MRLRLKGALTRSSMRRRRKRDCLLNHLHRPLLTCNWTAKNVTTFTPKISNETKRIFSCTVPTVRSFVVVNCVSAVTSARVERLRCIETRAAGTMFSSQKECMDIVKVTRLPAFLTLKTIYPSPNFTSNAQNTLRAEKRIMQRHWTWSRQTWKTFRVSRAVTSVTLFLCFPVQRVTSVALNASSFTVRRVSRIDSSCHILNLATRFHVPLAVKIPSSKKCIILNYWAEISTNVTRDLPLKSLCFKRAVFYVRSQTAEWESLSMSSAREFTARMAVGWDERLKTTTRI